MWYQGDPNFEWHHRLLVIQGDGGRWVGVTPDYDVQLVDLSQAVVRTVRRATPWPQDIAAQIYSFDPLDAGDEEDLIQQCKEFASVMGLGPRVDTKRVQGTWRLSDPSSTLFGEVVPEEALIDDECAVRRGSVGLVRIEGAWLAM